MTQHVSPLATESMFAKYQVSEFLLMYSSQDSSILITQAA